jgi:hypothetical protein
MVVANYKFGSSFKNRPLQLKGEKVFESAKHSDAIGEYLGCILGARLCHFID